MATNYYEHVRSDISDLLPAHAKRIVDVGCGAGATLGWLRGRYPTAHTIGLEGNPDVRDTLSRNADEAYTLDLNKDDMPDIGMPDLILFLDVLEHLPDPVAVLERLTRKLAPGGMVIVSVPNVAHFSISIPLMFRGEFTYKDAGILDRTHMRFFVQESAVELLEDAGLHVDGGLWSGIDGRKTRLLDRITLGTQRAKLAKQLVLRGRQAPGIARADFKWSLAGLSS